MTQRVTARRRVLKLLAGASLLPWLGCGTRGDDDACAPIPTEMGGPYPGDGTNGANALTSPGMVRSDLRSSFGRYTGTAAGVPLMIKLTLINVRANCAPLARHAIYLWHCDLNGQYS